MEGGVKGKGDKRCDRERNTDIFTSLYCSYICIYHFLIRDKVESYKERTCHRVGLIPGQNLTNDYSHY